MPSMPQIMGYIGVKLVARDAEQRHRALIYERTLELIDTHGLMQVAINERSSGQLLGITGMHRRWQAKFTHVR